MKLKFFLILLIAFTITLFPNPQEQNKKIQKIQPISYGMDYTVGLNFCYNRIPILIGDNDQENTLLHSYLALEVEVGVLNFLRLSAIAGFDSNRFDTPVDFFNLPLSLRIDDQSYNSMVFGIRAKSDLFSWREFSFKANAEFMFFKLFKKENTLTLPITTGASTVKQSFSQVAVELLAQYDGLSSISIFAGPQLNLLKGNITAQETIMELTGEEKLSYRQKNSLGLTGGTQISLSNHFDLILKLSLFSKNSLSAEVIYLF